MYFRLALATSSSWGSTLFTADGHTEDWAASPATPEFYFGDFSVTLDSLFCLKNLTMDGFFLYLSSSSLIFCSASAFIFLSFSCCLSIFSFSNRSCFSFFSRSSFSSFSFLSYFYYSSLAAFSCFSNSSACSFTCLTLSNSAYFYRFCSSIACSFLRFSSSRSFFSRILCFYLASSSNCFSFWSLNYSSSLASKVVYLAYSASTLPISLSSLSLEISPNTLSSSLILTLSLFLDCFSS